MSNGAACCALGICCPPRSAEQRKAIVEEMMHDEVCDAVTAAKVAEWLQTNYDLAPAGSLELLKKEIAKHARKADK